MRHNGQISIGNQSAMMTALGSDYRIGFQIAAFIAAGVILGVMNLFGLLVSAGFVLFLGGALVMMLFRKLYHRLFLFGILMLACVVVEPSPSDAVFCAAIPLGFISGEFRLQSLGRAFPVVVLLVAYSIAGLPGIVVSVDLEAAIRYYLITSYLFAFSLLVCMYANPVNIVSLLQAYVLAALFSFAVGLVGFLGFFPDLLMAYTSRVKGLFKDPNVYGPFFIPAIILLLDDWKRKKIWRLPRAAHAVGIIIMTLGVIFSFSRAAWISLAAAVFLYMILHLRTVRPARLAGITAAALVVLLLVVLAFQMPVLRDSDLVNFILERAQLQDYDSNRFTAQQGGLTLMIRHPLGVGPGQFENEIYKITGKRLSSHNLYVRTATESGILGGLLFVVSMACLLIMLWLRHRRTIIPYGSVMIRDINATVDGVPDTGIAPAALIAILSGILVNSLVVDTLHWRHFWFFIGIALYALREWGRQVKSHE